jgi:hypothetical protein
MRESSGRQWEGMGEWWWWGGGMQQAVHGDRMGGPCAVFVCACACKRVCVGWGLEGSAQSLKRDAGQACLWDRGRVVGLGLG